GRSGRWCAVIAFCRLLEATQRLGDAALVDAGQQVFQEPAPPAWREVEVSRERDAATARVEPDGDDAVVADDPQRGVGLIRDPVLVSVDRQDGEGRREGQASLTDGSPDDLPGLRRAQRLDPDLAQVGPLSVTQRIGE